MHVLVVRSQPSQKDHQHHRNPKAIITITIISISNSQTYCYISPSTQRPSSVYPTKRRDHNSFFWMTVSARVSSSRNARQSSSSASSSKRNAFFTITATQQQDAAPRFAVSTTWVSEMNKVVKNVHRVRNRVLNTGSSDGQHRTITTKQK
jgi:hypothetical protein